MKYLFCVSLLLLSVQVQAETETGELFTGSNKTELKEIKLNMDVKAIPKNRFKNFTCANDSKPLDALTDFAQCTPDALNLHEVGLEFDTTENEWAKVNDKLAGTTVAGYPVILSILLDANGTVQGVRAETDSSVRRYLKRQAYLLYRRVKANYGPSDWECIDGEPVEGEKMPMGRVFIDKKCIKNTDDKRIILVSKVYREPEQTVKNFTNYSIVEVISQSVFN